MMFLFKSREAPACEEKNRKCGIFHPAEGRLWLQIRKNSTEPAYNIFFPSTEQISDTASSPVWFP